MRVRGGSAATETVEFGWCLCVREANRIEMGRLYIDGGEQVAVAGLLAAEERSFGLWNVPCAAFSCWLMLRAPYGSAEAAEPTGLERTQPVFGSNRRP